MLYGAEEFEAVLSDKTHNLNKSREYDQLKPWLGNGLLTSRVSLWRPRRKLLTPTFHYDILKEFVDVFYRQANVTAIYPSIR
jgi:cytochrome P450